MKPDIDIARAARLLPIAEVGAAIGLEPGELEPYGRHKAKVTRLWRPDPEVRRSVWLDLCSD